MKPYVVICAALAMLLGAAGTGVADIAIPGKPYKRPTPPSVRPQPKPVAARPTHPLHVKYDDNIKNAVLRLPRNLASAAGKNNQADATRPSHTIIAGIALSCAAASVLVWRRGGKSTRFVVLGIVSLSVIAGGMTYADLLPPGQRPKRGDDPQVVNQSLQVLIEFVDGKELTLTLPTSAMPGNEETIRFGAPDPSDALPPPGTPDPTSEEPASEASAPPAP